MVTVGASLLAQEGDCRRLRFDPWVGRSPRGGHGGPLLCSCLENRVDRGAWRAAVHGATKSRTPPNTRARVPAALQGSREATARDVHISVLTRLVPIESLGRRTDGRHQLCDRGASSSPTLDHWQTPRRQNKLNPLFPCDSY